jgi:hypothetical protein
MSGIFGMSAVALEQQVAGLARVVDALLAMNAPGITIRSIDPYNGWCQVTLKHGEHEMWGGGSDVMMAIQTAQAQQRALTAAAARSVEEAT